MVNAVPKQTAIYDAVEFDGLRAVCSAVCGQFFLHVVAEYLPDYHEINP